MRIYIKNWIVDMRKIIVVSLVVIVLVSVVLILPRSMVSSDGEIVQKENIEQSRKIEADPGVAVRSSEALSETGAVVTVESKVKGRIDTKSQLSQRYPQQEVQELLGLNPDSTDIKRRRALDALFDRANPSDLNFLYEYLYATKPDAISFEEHYANINNILDFLLLEHAPIERTETQLLTMLEQEEVDRFTKMSILQRLDILHEKGERSNVVQAHLWDFAAKKGTRLAGVALSSLTRLSVHTTAIDQDALALVITDILKEENADELTQVVALQIATWMDLPTVEALAEKFLTPERPSITLQLAAVNTFYKRKNVSRLQKLSNSTSAVDEDVRRALKNAIALLNEEKL